MSLSTEHDFLLQSVKKWFNHPEQITHYTNELDEGPTVAEQYLHNTLPSSGSVLDVGCGAGRISMCLAEAGYRVTGIDVSEGLLSIARESSKKRNMDIDFMITDRTVLPFHDEEFQILVGFKILCYIPSRQLRNDYLLELYRVLKPGGAFIITQNIVPEEYMDESRDENYHKSPASQFMTLEQGDTFPLGNGYVRWFTESDLLSELRNTDFEIELFESDEEHGGTGYLRLIKLKKPFRRD